MSDSQLIWEGRVNAEWVDYNNHMNDAAYAIVFSMALDSMLDKIGLDEAFREQNHYTAYTLETHVLYRKEAVLDEKLDVFVQILDKDEKRLHLWMEMKNESSELAAASEQMIMGMDQAAGRPAPFPPALVKGIEALPHTEAEFRPSMAGRAIGIKKK
ncbi:acyl-CoA thioester hydrolase [Sinobaca qinghaiensis]|uniref:Acyl-CoA thioester hydrolase n=1 Tax=Sinobaca qinghaiensis TaxID=342944 RepID=A0A419UX78_9BACL|nr:thioesterase family protein [Sinobaca qinghaiensis]RKD69721.1 acyl-CoA thioester hydrolase [Sinobaca qinghaiensis]